MTTYNWTIAELERDTATGGITVAHWRVSAEDGEYTASAYGSVGFKPDATAADFTPYDQVTEAQCLQWVLDQLGAEQVQAIADNLAANIEDQKAPKVASGTPWA